ncbi:MAG: DUF4340 domain-containing protein [Kiritimatiellae bacterium]|nr:DUF4340 domain-containing protein [Kiritimatiellia bacterium]MDW8459071.1 DUF4340 domain-containing protein [Verrucomicrobiota bacterium]
MKPRTLVLLAAALIVLSIAAYWSQQRDLAAQQASEVGSRLLKLEDINQVVRVDLISGTQSVSIARTGEGWVNRSRWDYPARFETLAAFLRDLDRLRVAEVIRGGAEILPDVGLVDDGTNTPLIVRLYTEASVDPADELTIGKPRAATAMAQGFSLPDSRFMRRARGPVVLAEPFIQDVPRRASDWIRATVLDIKASEIRRMMAVPSNDFMYAIIRADDSSYIGEGSLHGVSINTAGAESWFRAFQGIMARDVADPATARESLGYDSADLAVAHLTNGLVVRVHIGATAGDEGRRYAWLDFDYEGPAEGEENDHEGFANARAELERYRKDLGKWTFVLDDSQVRRLLFFRDQLVAAPAPSEGPPPTNQETSEGSQGNTPPDPAAAPDDAPTPESAPLEPSAEADASTESDSPAAGVESP